MKEIKFKLSQDLKNALKVKNSSAVKAIRSLMSAIDNAGAITVEAPETMPMSGGIAGASSGFGSTEAIRKELSNEDIKQIIQDEISELASAIQAINDDTMSEVKELKEQMDVLENYL